MRRIISSLHMAPALRQMPLSETASNFLSSADPRKSPFWILFGYLKDEKIWRNHYALSSAPSLPNLRRSAQEFERISRMVRWQEWPDLFRRMILKFWSSPSGPCCSPLQKFMCFVMSLEPNLLSVFLMIFIKNEFRERIVTGRRWRLCWPRWAASRRRRASSRACRTLPTR